jgi:malonyl-CoA O-methyltransferase
MNVNQEICNAFNKYASEYEKNAKVQTEIGLRLFERLDYLAMKPQYILDLGCGPGYFSKLLKQRYPEALIVSFDLAHAMLLQVKTTNPLDWALVEGDMQRLPFANGIFDLVFANQVVHWAPTLTTVFRELNRVMQTDGCLMFTTLGPDTFKEFKQAWKTADTYSHSLEFLDMHNVGDSLMAERLLEPVVDMEMLTVHYESLSALMHSLKAQGVRNVNQKRNRGLTGKTTWKNFTAAYEGMRTVEGKYPLSYEIIYGHAWKGKQGVTDQGVETFFPISQLRSAFRR